jgi:adenosylmethionine-8-amino-7-oxononanoate aminotransferase
MNNPSEAIRPDPVGDQHVFHSAVRRQYPVISHGEGCYLYDTEGNRYLDACGGAMVVNLGHGIPEIARAMQEQASRVAFAHRGQFTNVPLQRLAALVADMAPADLDLLFPVTGGSEAVETAIKLAHKYHRDRGRPEKRKVIARWQSYHGNTLGALSASGFSQRRAQYTSLLLDFPHIAPMYCYRCPFGKTYPECGVACADDLERLIRQEGAHTISAFIAEPLVAAAGGAPVPPPEYFPRIREICDRHDVLLIADEIVTGFGRTGRAFAIQHWDVVPDLIVVAKGMSSGYAPLAGVIARRSIVETIRDASGLFSHGYTYGGNPVGAAVGVSVLEYLRQHRLIERAAEMGAHLHERLGALRAHPSVGDVRGLGLLAGIEFVRDRATKAPFDSATGYGLAVVQEAMRRGLLVYPGTGSVDGVAGDHILLAPPFIITRQQIDDTVRLLDETLTATEQSYLV